MPAKPKKPYPDFPLFAHQSGQWAKKIRGKTHYFGTWADPDAALARFKAEQDDLYAGMKPVRHDGTSVSDACNEFLIAKRARIETGELTVRTWEEYKKSAARMVRVLGRSTPVEKLTPSDFEKLRADIASTRKAVSLSNEVQRCRTILKFAYDHGLIAQPVRYGSAFSKATKKVLRVARNARPKRFLEPEAIRAMIGVADVHARAQLLLGINAGFGQMDLATLPKAAVDLESGWVRFARQKTGIDRECPLWPETIESLRESQAKRWPGFPHLAHLWFVTKAGNELVWFREGKGGRMDSVGAMFRKYALRCGVKLSGVGFYSLRHTFRTVADECRDPAAVKRIMGHSEEDPTDEMRAIYVERIAPERLTAVTEHVRKWLNLAGQCPDNVRSE